ncbi:hypothetical protein I656_03294 [Geobacillus sp. WSUCF1]|nr:hypothetical protein I656_03294 [Geobacillus sp. WSUCF1]
MYRYIKVYRKKEGSQYKDSGKIENLLNIGGIVCESLCIPRT